MELSIKGFYTFFLYFTFSAVVFELIAHTVRMYYYKKEALRIQEMVNQSKEMEEWNPNNTTH